jgi:hypothetical protein
VLILDLSVLSRQTRSYRQRRPKVPLPLTADDQPYEDGAR